MLRLTLHLKRLFLMVAIVVANASLAGPPFVTDDPETVAYQHWEINYGLSKTESDGSYSAGLPSIDINYGFTTNMQLHVQPRYTLIADAGTSIHGIDNTEIGIKYRFVNNAAQDSTFMLGIYPMMELPTGDNKLSPGDGKTQGFLPIWAQYQQDEWTVYGGAGYRLNNWTNSKNSVFMGTTIMYKLTEKMALGVEIFNESATSIGDKSTSGFNMGGTYDFTEDFHLLFSLGKGLSNIAATNTLSLYIALQTTY